MADRRSLILALAAAVGGGAWTRRPPDAVHALLDRAMARAGGRGALGAAQQLHWRGQARIFAGERTIEIGVSTRVRPFQAARSDSWLLSDGPAKSRSLIIEGGKGWLERDGKREPMPARMLAHETAQYAIYGLMLLGPLRDKGASVAPAEGRDGLSCLATRHPGAPDTVLCFDAEARLARALNRVPSPDADGMIDQRFDFEGEITGGGVRWPRKLVITQDGKPYFELTLHEFTIEAAEPGLHGEARPGER